MFRLSPGRQFSFAAVAQAEAHPANNPGVVACTDGVRHQAKNQRHAAPLQHVAMQFTTFINLAR